MVDWDVKPQPKQLKGYINGPGHMTKMVAMTIYGKNLQKSFPAELNPVIMKLSMEHYKLKLYTFYMMTL